MLPRLKPRTFYDFVVQVAIVRPGPIQGGMVHPYLERRALRERGELPPSPYPALDAALGRTLGVPIFQEQVMQICVIAAGFTPGEADGLRRSMAAWRKKGELHVFHDRIVQGMVQRGYPQDFAQAIFRQIEGFGEYGFPESHAYSFALLTYLSAWMKCHEPESFLAALLNSQPMGFYAPSQLVQDARRHGVQVLPVDVCHSDWNCTLERAGPASAKDGSAAAPTPVRPAVRLGLRMVSGLAQALALRLVQARQEAPFADVHDLASRAHLSAADLQRLAAADALQGLAGHRRQQLWQASGVQRASGMATAATADLFEHLPSPETQVPELAPSPEGQAVTLDYASTGLSLRRHPLALMRPRLHQRGWRSALELQALPDGRRAWACGLVTMRQQPATAKGTTFITLEDETGCINVIVWRHIREAQRQVVLNARLLAVVGQWQNRQGVTHLVARRLLDVSPWLGELGRVTASRDFR
jgi:error-prone DNA polymerase